MIFRSVLVAAFAVVASAKLGPASKYFDICRLSDPEYNKCVTNSLIKARPAIVKGIPEIGIVPLDPLFIPRLQLKQGEKNFRFSQVLSNLTITGAGDFTIKHVNLDHKNGIFDTVGHFDKINMEGDYQMDGQILVLPISGSGKVMYNFSDITITFNCKFEDFVKGDKTYWRMKSVKLRIDPNGARSYFTNLFNGDKRLGESTNKFLNDNWREAYNTYRELPESAFGSLYSQMANGVLQKFPKEELFPK